MHDWQTDTVLNEYVCKCVLNGVTFAELKIPLIKLRSFFIFIKQEQEIKIREY